MEAMTSGLVPAAESPNGELGVWAQTFLQLAEVAAALAPTNFIPASLRVEDRGHYDAGATAAQVTAAIMTGQELGFEPMASLQQFAVVNGRPALSALGLRALVQRSGHQIRVVEQTKTRAVVEGKRADDTEWQRVTWTIDDAKDRGLAGRPNWRTMPRNMLVARATAEVARLIAADAILGVPYVIEELEDGDEALEPTAPEAISAPAPPRTARRRRSPAPSSPPPPAPPGAEDDPGLDERPVPSEGGTPAPAAPSDEPPLEEERPPISDDQRKALHAGFRDLGIERPERLRIVAGVVGRQVTSANELDQSEASRVLDEIALTKARQTPVADAATGEVLDEPALDEPERPADAPATGEDFVTIRVLFDAAKYPGGREGQDTRVRYASGIVGRKLADPRDLSHAEAEEVIAALRMVVEDMGEGEEEGM